MQLATCRAAIITFRGCSPLRASGKRAAKRKEKLAACTCAFANCIAHALWNNFQSFTPAFFGQARHPPLQISTATKGSHGSMTLSPKRSGKTAFNTCPYIGRRIGGPQ